MPHLLDQIGLRNLWKQPVAQQSVPPPGSATDLRVSSPLHDKPWTDCVRLRVQFGQICITREASIWRLAYALRCSHAFLLTPPPLTRVTLHYFCGGLMKMKEQTSGGFRRSPASHAGGWDLGARMMSPCLPAGLNSYWTGSRPDVRECKILTFSYCSVTVSVQNVWLHELEKTDEVSSLFCFFISGNLLFNLRFKSNFIFQIFVAAVSFASEDNPQT